MNKLLDWLFPSRVHRRAIRARVHYLSHEERARRVHDWS
jgi:hypothetical protein